VYVSAHDAWARKHEEKAKQERKQNEAWDTFTAGKASEHKS
jgi:hypothetical protein